MRKLIFLLLSAAMVLSLEAWGDTQTTAVTAAKVNKAKKCLFPKSKKRAPDWVCNAKAEGMAVAAVGSSAKSDAGISFMEQMAAVDARVHLAQKLRDSVESKITDSEASASKTQPERDSTLITRITNESLRDTKILKSAYSPNGTLYVMVGLDEEGVKTLLDSISADYLAHKRQ